MQQLFDVQGFLQHLKTALAGLRLQVGQVLVVGDDVGSLAVLENQLDAVCGIVRVAGDVGGARLHDAEHGEYQAAGARQQHRHAVAALHAMGDERMGHTVHLGIHLAEGEGAVAGHESLGIGLLRSIGFDSLMEQARGHFCRAGQAE